MVVKQSQNRKTPLVLLHGWGVNSAVWAMLTDQLAVNFDVICLDLPGFGFNHQLMPEQYTLEQLADVLLPKCPNNCIVAGWSLGGLVAIQMALQAPRKVLSIGLIASTPCFVEQPNWLGIKPEILNQFGQQLSVDLNKTVERFLAIQAMGSASARADIKQLKQAVLQRPAANEQALAAGLSLLKHTDLRSELQSLSIPVRAILGQRDTLVASQPLINFGQGMNDFDSSLLPKASHAPFISHSDEFVASLNKLYGY